MVPGATTTAGFAKILTQATTTLPATNGREVAAEDIKKSGKRKMVDGIASSSTSPHGKTDGDRDFVTTTDVSVAVPGDTFLQTVPRSFSVQSVSAWSMSLLHV